MTLVSIIIPNFNRANLISETLASLCAQTYMNWEAIVVDDGSTDNSEEIVIAFSRHEKRIKWVKRNRNPRGAPTCRNIGLNNAAGELIIFLDSDDILAPWCLEKRIEQFKKYPQHDCLIFPILIFYNRPGDSDVLFSSYRGDDALTQFINQKSPWQSMGPIWKKESVKEMGGWDESLATWQDWEFPIRAMVKGLRYKIVGDLPDCFLRRSEHERLSSNDMTLSRLESKLMLFKKVMDLIEKDRGLTGDYKKAFARLYFSHAERMAIRMPDQKIINDFIEEVKDLKVLSHLQIAGLLIYIKLLRLAQQAGFKKATSVIYKLGHSLLPSFVRSIENKPAHLKKQRVEEIKKLMKDYAI